MLRSRKLWIRLFFLFVVHRTLANDDFLVKTIMSNKYNLWPEDSVELQNEWINSIQLLMQTLEEKYAPAPPVEVEGGGE